MAKRNYVLGFMAILLFTVLAACGSTEEADVEAEEQTAETDEPAGSEEEEAGVEVDKGLFNVEVTLPAFFFDSEEEVERTIEHAETEDGFSEATQNEDGSITYKMTKAKHSELMDELDKEVQNTMDSITSDEDLASIEEVTSDSDHSNFTLVVAQEAYENSFDGFAALGLGMSGMLYQLFDGADPDQLDVEINVEDSETGEVFSTVNYPEALENAE
jgi:hypothetical protein